MTAELISRYAPPAYRGDSEEHADELRAITIRVRDYMLDGTFRTAAEIRAALSLAPETDVLRRLRECRSVAFGGWNVAKRLRGGRTWEYAVQPRISKIVVNDEIQHGGGHE